MNLANGQFQILAKLGAGGFASVYRGAQASPKRDVAIKVLHETLATNSEVVQRFHHEAQTLAAFDHPNIMKIYFEGQESGLHYFVANMLREDLRKRLDRKGLLPLPEALRILRQVTDALGYMHRKGFVHRDFKPANILFDENDNAVLTDFGLARGSELSMITQPGMVLGTAAYMAPEQIQGGSKGVGPSADLYALGCVMYEVLEGQPPFPNTDFFATCHSHLYEAAPPMRNPEVPERIREAVDALLAKKPEERPDSADHVLEELQSAELDLARLRGAPPRRDYRAGRISPGDGSPTPVTPQPTRALPENVAGPSGSSGAGEWSMAVPTSAMPAPSTAAPKPQDTVINTVRVGSPVQQPSLPPPKPYPAPPAPPAPPTLSGEWARHAIEPEKTVEMEAETPLRIPPPAGSPGGSKGFRFPLWIGFVLLAFAVALATQMMGRGKKPSAPTTGTAVVRLNPASAVASLDGKPLPGLAPFVLSFPPGEKHTLTATLTGHRSQSLDFSTHAGSSDTFMVELPAEVQELAQSSPSPAVSTPPAAVKTTRIFAPAGSAAPAKPKVPVPAPTAPRETAKPSADPGRITVTAVPFVVSLALDGGEMDHQTPCTFQDVTPGAHRVLASKAGYSLKEAYMNDVPVKVDGDELEVALKPGSTLRLRLIFEKN